MSEITIKKLLDEIIINRNEIKTAIQSSEANLLLKIDEANNRISQLETENIQLKQEMEILKQNCKKNNIVIFGIKHQEDELNFEFVKQEIQNLLEVELEEKDINDIYSLGRSEDSPIKIELATYLKKKYILQNSHKLAGTKIFINHDLTEKQREENRLLRKHLNIAKKDKNKTCYIKSNKLYINNRVVTIEELKDLDHQEVSEELELGVILNAQDHQKLEKEVDNPKRKKIKDKRRRMIK